MFELFVSHSQTRISLSLFSWEYTPFVVYYYIYFSTFYAHFIMDIKWPCFSKSFLLNLHLLASFGPKFQPVCDSTNSNNHY